MGEETDPPRRFVTSVRVDHKPGAPHAYVTVWIRGANVGTLCVREDEAVPLEALLLGDRDKLDRIAAAADRVMGIDVLAREPELVERARESSACANGIHSFSYRQGLADCHCGARTTVLPESAPRLHRELTRTPRRLIPIGPERVAFLEPGSNEPTYLTPWMSGPLDAMRSPLTPDATPCPPSLELDAATMAWAVEQGVTEADVAQLVDTFVAYQRTTPTRHTLFDWQSKLRAWVYRTFSTPPENVFFERTPETPDDARRLLAVRRMRDGLDAAGRASQRAHERRSFPHLADALGDVSSHGEARAQARARTVVGIDLAADASPETRAAVKAWEERSVPLVTEGREFHVAPSVLDNLDEMNAGRAARGMPPLAVKLTNDVPGFGAAGDVVELVTKNEP